MLVFRIPIEALSNKPDNEARSADEKDNQSTLYNQFLNETATANLAVCEVYNEYNDWISPFMMTRIPDVHSCTNPKPI